MLAEIVITADIWAVMRRCRMIRWCVTDQRAQKGIQNVKRRNRLLQKNKSDGLMKLYDVLWLCSIEMKKSVTGSELSILRSEVGRCCFRRIPQFDSHTFQNIWKVWSNDLVDVLVRIDESHGELQYRTLRWLTKYRRVALSLIHEIICGMPIVWPDCGAFLVLRTNISIVISRHHQLVRFNVHSATTSRISNCVRCLHISFGSK